MAKSAFRGGSYGGGMNMNMIKQAQKMQQDMLKMQEDIEKQSYEASSGGGAVKAVASGKNELLSLEIAPDAVDAQAADGGGACHVLPSRGDLPEGHTPHIII